MDEKTTEMLLDEIYKDLVMPQPTEEEIEEMFHFFLQEAEREGYDNDRPVPLL